LRLERLEDRCLLNGLTLAEHSFFGGSGDQRGTAISISGGAIYLSGNAEEIQSPAARALLLKYSVAPGVSSVWSRSFDSGSNFFGLTSTNEGVYPAGYSWSLTTDSVGGKEVKSILGRFALDGSSGPGPEGSTWVAGSGGTASRGAFFTYSGVEASSAVTATVEDGSTFLYAVGGGQPYSYGAYLVAKYDTSGNRLAAATDSTVGVSFDALYIPSYGGSSAFGVTVLKGNVYLAGNTGWPHEGDSGGRPALWKYDRNLNLLWRQKDTALNGRFQAVAEFGGALYAAGYAYAPAVADSENFLIQKYDEAGNRSWTTVSGGASTDALTSVVGIGGRLFAVGYTRSEGAGGLDAVLLEIDPATGAILSRALFGGAQDDRANGVATEGNRPVRCGRIAELRPERERRGAGRPDAASLHPQPARRWPRPGGRIRRPRAAR